MFGRAAAALLFFLLSLICGCRGAGNFGLVVSQSRDDSDPQIESVWAVRYHGDANTSQLQGVLSASGSIAVSQTVEFPGEFVAGGTDPGLQLMFGELLPLPYAYPPDPHRQLLIFHYDANSARQLSAIEVPVPPGEASGSIAVIPALRAVYLLSYIVGDYADTPGHILLLHYNQDGTVAGPVDVTPPLNRYSVAVFSDLAYGEKTALLYGRSYYFAHTQPGPFPAFATVTSEGVPSSFTWYTAGPKTVPQLTSWDFCLDGGGALPLAYTRDGAFQVSYNSEENALTVTSVERGVANFASRTDQFGTDCAGPVVNGAALDEHHKAIYAVLQTLDAQVSAPVSAVLARFDFDSATGSISPKPVQQISIAATDRLFIPRYGSNIFVFGRRTSLTAYALTGEGPQNPELVPLSFVPDLLFGDVPRL